jgi:hypothetical protein
MAMKNLVSLALFSMLSLAACGDDSADGGGVSNDPGREVAGCFDCSDTEYCLVISGDSEKFHCAEASCGLGCDCIVDDGAARLEVCQTQYSCQDGSGILYCFE